MVREYLALVIVILAMLMLFVKSAMVYAYRQNSFFIQKLSRSFGFYDDKKIDNAFEYRLKLYYKNSNMVNKAFYSIIMFSFSIYAFFILLNFFHA